MIFCRVAIIIAIQALALSPLIRRDRNSNAAANTGDSAKPSRRAHRICGGRVSASDSADHRRHPRLRPPCARRVRRADAGYRRDWKKSRSLGASDVKQHRHNSRANLRAADHSQYHPAGATVIVDGRRRGTTPLTLDGVGPGRTPRANRQWRQHVDHNVTVERGTTTSLLIPLAQSGWIDLRAPIDVQVFEGGRSLGSSSDGPLALPLVHTSFSSATKRSASKVVRRSPSSQAESRESAAGRARWSAAGQCAAVGSRVGGQGSPSATRSSESARGARP